ncbi:hypothetical protein ACFWQC_28140 [Nocardioides sp. NPDC058538]|uniref:hypothetical protein n=1 Tax=Nocardioides sp. NPDC058538 TaxID=3346542 RepID=UPI0036478915
MEWLTEPLTLGDHLVQWGVCVPIAAGFVVGIARMAVRGQREGRVTAKRGADLAEVVPFPRKEPAAAPRASFFDDDEGVRHAGLPAGYRSGKHVVPEPAVIVEDRDVLADVVVLPFLPRGIEGTERGGWFA